MLRTFISHLKVVSSYGLIHLMAKESFFNKDVKTTPLAFKSLGGKPETSPLAS